MGLLLKNLRHLLDKIKKSNLPREKVSDWAGKYKPKYTLFQVLEEIVESTQHWSNGSSNTRAAHAQQGKYYSL